MSNDKIRVRMAPSPTGFLHIGGLRTALYNYLFAKQNDGSFILRIEDTDRNRLVEGALENIVETLYDFGLQPDEGPYWDAGKVSERGDYGPYLQSERLPIYKRYADELVAKGSAYHCFCTPQRLDELRKNQEAQKLAPKYDKLCLKLSKEETDRRLASGESHVIRLNVPKDLTVRFTDAVHGEIAISTNDIDDQVLMKSDGFPTYHLAVVVDDHSMAITHVIRGEEWIPSTPKHVLLYSAFGWETPQFVHLPLLLSKSRKKMSKRDGDVAVKDFLKNGYLPEALINFVALLGWNPKTEEEIFSLDQLMKRFDIGKLNKAGAIFDLDKLDWINGLYIRKLPKDDLFNRCYAFLKSAHPDLEKYPKAFLEKIVLLEQERLTKLSQIGERVAYFFARPEYDPAILVWKKSDLTATKNNLFLVRELLAGMSADDFVRERLEERIKKLIADNSLTNGEVLWPLRVSLSGLEASPGPFEIMDAFGALPDGKEEVLARIDLATGRL